MADDENFDPMLKYFMIMIAVMAGILYMADLCSRCRRLATPVPPMPPPIPVLVNGTRLPPPPLLLAMPLPPFGEVLVYSKNCQSDHTQEDCAICLDEFQDGAECRVLLVGASNSRGCGHLFHKVCIDAWMRNNSICPMCRDDVQSYSVNSPTLVADEQV